MIHSVAEFIRYFDGIRRRGYRMEDVVARARRGPERIC